MNDHEAAAARFFDAFVTAFTSFDGNVIAERYGSPYLALLRDDGQVLSRWRESYILSTVGDDMKVIASVDHAGDESTGGNKLTTEGIR